MLAAARANWLFGTVLACYGVVLAALTCGLLAAVSAAAALAVMVWLDRTAVNRL